jgi:Glycosyl hydrolase family 3 C-terminal domain/Fibronectin type III-like domain
MAGLVATEGADQPDANLLNDQNRMLDELLNINPATVVVLKDSNPVLMPWIDKAPAVLEAWNQGAEDGHVVADLLFVAGQPPKRLVGFQKVFVEPGESKPVTVTIDPAATKPPVQRLGLLHAQIRDQAGGVQRLRWQLRRQPRTRRPSRLTEPGDSWIAQVRSLPQAPAPSSDNIPGDLPIPSSVRRTFLPAECAC